MKQNFLILRKITVIGFSALLLLSNHEIWSNECSVKFQGEEAFLLSQHVSDNGLLEKFDDLESQLESSGNPIQEARDFMNSYIDQMNIHYGSSLTIEEACDIAKNNLDKMNLPQDAYKQAMMILDLLHANQENIQDGRNINKTERTFLSVSFPWEWNWFGLNKHSHKKKSHDKHTVSVQSETITEIPGVFPFVVGLVEGAIGLAVFPFNPVAGGLLIGDGCTRVIQGIQENIQENSENKPGQSSNGPRFPQY